ncbi:SDR family oxidoreductase [Terasakiella sp.]|uniref:SDR family oxidoreductase n=1 Tax=Terasakiella sp. TaxID=2034861 RepID=UPI003AA862B9
MGMTTPDIVIFGARTGTGLELAKIARGAERNVVGVIRPDSDPSELLAWGVQVVYADALNPKQVANAIAIAHSNWIGISTLGGPDNVDYKGNVAVIDAACKDGAQHFLLVSSLGCGNSREFASQRLLDAIGSVLTQKTKAEEYLQSSGLSYTIVRPGGLINEPASGQGALYESPAVHGRINRTDLARVLWRSLENPQCEGKVFSAIDRGMLQAPEGTREFMP